MLSPNWIPNAQVLHGIQNPKTLRILQAKSGNNSQIHIFEFSPGNSESQGTTSALLSRIPNKGDFDEKYPKQMDPTQ